MKTEQSFATASQILGIIGVATFYFGITPLICGSLAVIFALLSRDEHQIMSKKAKTGLILGVIGLIIGCIIFIAAITIIYNRFGSFSSYYMQFYNNYNTLGGFIYAG